MNDWVQLTMYEEKRVEPELIEECLASLRKIQAEGQVTLEARALCFRMGQDLLDWAQEVKTTIEPHEVKQ